MCNQNQCVITSIFSAAFCTRKTAQPSFVSRLTTNTTCTAQAALSRREGCRRAPNGFMSSFSGWENGFHRNVALGKINERLCSSCAVKAMIVSFSLRFDSGPGAGVRHLSLQEEEDRTGKRSRACVRACDVQAFLSLNLDPLQQHGDG